MMSSVITARPVFNPKDAQSIQALVAATVSAAKGTMAFVQRGTPRQGSEAQALIDSMIDAADKIKNGSTEVKSTIQNKL